MNVLRLVMHRFGRSGVWLALLLLFGSVAAPARADDTLEQRVKAAFLFNFAKFVSWPAAKLPGAADPILFCVLERDPIASTLEATLAGKSIDRHPLLLRRVGRPEELRGCQIAYLGGIDPSRTPVAFETMAGESVLSVYDAEVAQAGGIVRFYLDERRVHFEINETAALREGLQVSSRLLGVARVIRE